MNLIKIALIGNPNIGKSSLFNQLTGLKQKVGNYPGITVDKKTGLFTHGDEHYKLFDLPGTYSLYPNSQDEEIASDVLIDHKHKDHPDKIIVVADATNLKRSLQIFEQVIDLQIPVILAINMVDEAEKKGIKIDLEQLRTHYGVPIVFTCARTGKGMNELKKKLTDASTSKHRYGISSEFVESIHKIQSKLNLDNEYIAWYLLSRSNAHFLNTESKTFIKELREEYEFIPKRLQVKEFLSRNSSITQLLEKAQEYSSSNIKNITSRIDKWAMHPFWGYVIFAVILLIVFQSIFTLSEYPMQWIESGFIYLSTWLKSILPKGPVNGLISEGIIPGIGGILIFVPQIAILFFLLLILEETGYMSRVVFLMDRLMRPFGMNGKSVVPLISGAACAIPAVMSARNIENRKEKLITVLVTPFMTCSARLPVYSLIIGLVFSDQSFGFLNLKGLILLLMYFLGLLAALGAGVLLRFILKDRFASYLAMEIPIYRSPVWKNVFITLWDKVKAFVFGAGKIILAISIILWVLASFGPNMFKEPKEEVYATANMTPKEKEASKKSYVLEHSYLGLVGNWFEPAIKPLGYDWKTGIGIMASFAAREVFVPTMATIYSISDNDEGDVLKEKMRKEVDSSGKPVYNLASGVSLLLFYAFAMMCMSTFAAVRRETNSWKWPLIQLISMSGFAYLVALIAYQILK